MPTINTVDQLRFAGGGIAIAYHPATAFRGWKWAVIKVDGFGVMIRTDGDAAQEDYGMKVFLIHGRGQVKSRLEEAQAWVKEIYKEEGPWVRNRRGDYVPRRINQKFPLRKREQIKTMLKGRA